MEKKFIRQIFYYKNYYLDFFNEQSSDVQKKLNWTLQLIAEMERVPSKFFKHIEGSDGIYEIRAEYASKIFRVFSFFDKGQLVILLNGFQKKSEKTPKKEIELAEKLKKQYFDEKERK